MPPKRAERPLLPLLLCRHLAQMLHVLLNVRQAASKIAFRYVQIKGFHGMSKFTFSNDFQSLGRDQVECFSVRRFDELKPAVN